MLGAKVKTEAGKNLVELVEATDARDIIQETVNSRENEKYEIDWDAQSDNDAVSPSKMGVTAATNTRKVKHDDGITNMEQNDSPRSYETVSDGRTAESYSAEFSEEQNESEGSWEESYVWSEDVISSHGHSRGNSFAEDPQRITLSSIHHRNSLQYLEGNLSGAAETTDPELPMAVPDAFEKLSKFVSDQAYARTEDQRTGGDEDGDEMEGGSREPSLAPPSAQDFTEPNESVGAQDVGSSVGGLGRPPVPQHAKLRKVERKKKVLRRRTVDDDASPLLEGFKAPASLGVSPVTYKKLSFSPGMAPSIKKAPPRYSAAWYMENMETFESLPLPKKRKDKLKKKLQTEVSKKNVNDENAPPHTKLPAPGQYSPNIEPVLRRWTSNFKFGTEARSGITDKGFRTCTPGPGAYCPNVRFDSKKKRAGTAVFSVWERPATRNLNGSRLDVSAKKKLHRKKRGSSAPLKRPDSEEFGDDTIMIDGVPLLDLVGESHGDTPRSSIAPDELSPREVDDGGDESVRNDEVDTHGPKDRSDEPVDSRIAFDGINMDSDGNTGVPNPPPHASGIPPPPRLPSMSLGSDGKPLMIVPPVPKSHEASRGAKTTLRPSSSPGTIMSYSTKVYDKKYKQLWDEHDMSSSFATVGPSARLGPNINPSPVEARNARVGYVKTKTIDKIAPSISHLALGRERAEEDPYATEPTGAGSILEPSPARYDPEVAHLSNRLQNKVHSFGTEDRFGERRLQPHFSRTPGPGEYQPKLDGTSKFKGGNTGKISSSLRPISTNWKELQTVMSNKNEISGADIHSIDDWERKTRIKNRPKPEMLKSRTRPFTQKMEPVRPVSSCELFVPNVTLDELDSATHAGRDDTDMDNLMDEFGTWCGEDMPKTPSAQPRRPRSAANITRASSTIQDDVEDFSFSITKSSLRARSAPFKRPGVVSMIYMADRNRTSIGEYQYISPPSSPAGTFEQNPNLSSPKTQTAGQALVDTLEMGIQKSLTSTTEDVSPSPSTAFARSNASTPKKSSHGEENHLLLADVLMASRPQHDGLAGLGAGIGQRFMALADERSTSRSSTSSKKKAKSSGRSRASARTQDVDAVESLVEVGVSSAELSAAPKPDASPEPVRPTGQVVEIEYENSFEDDVGEEESAIPETHGDLPVSPEKSLLDVKLMEEDVKSSVSAVVEMPSMEGVAEEQSVPCVLEQSAETAYEQDDFEAEDGQDGDDDFEKDAEHQGDDCGEDEKAKSAGMADTSAVDEELGAMLVEGEQGDEKTVEAGDNPESQAESEAEPEVVKTPLERMLHAESKAQEHFEAKDFESCVNCANEAIEASKELDDQPTILGMLYLGRARYEMGDYDGAVEIFDDLLDIEDDNADGFYYRGLVYYKQGRMGLALTDFADAIDLNPAFQAQYYDKIA